MTAPDLKRLEEIHAEMAELASTAVLRQVPYEFATALADSATRLRLLITSIKEKE
jgi:hypothetical protein